MQKKKIFLQVVQLVALFANVVALVIAILYYVAGGGNWGGKLPFLVNLTLIFMMVAGIVGLGVLGRVFYQLNLNKNYDGSQGSIRAILFVGLLYLIVAILGGVSISQYSNSGSACSQQHIFSLWEKQVYEEGAQAYNNFCHQCKCKITASDLKSYSPTQLQSMNYSSTDGAEDISKCKPEEGGLESDTFDKLKVMEKSYNCAGFCTSNLAYTFQGTSYGIPSGSNGCFGQIQIEFKQMKAIMLSINITLLMLMISSFIGSVVMRKRKYKDLLVENGALLYEPINSISIIGVSNIEDWRCHDNISHNSDQQQKSSMSNNQNHLHHLKTNYQQPNQNTEDGSPFNQSQFFDKNQEQQIQINKMKSMRKAFRSMHMPHSTLKKN